MEIGGFEVVDMVGRGVAGQLPVAGLTLLFGRNASGKTVLLETAASFLDTKSEWRGRRGRLDDNEQFAYGTWYLRGDWDNDDDWAWVQAVMSNQTRITEEERKQGHKEDIPPFEPLVTNPESASRADFVSTLADSVIFEQGGTREDEIVVSRALSELTRQMLITYAPWPGAQVNAVIDCADLAEDLRTRIGLAAEVLAGTGLAERFRAVAAASDGVVTLMGLGVLDELNFDDLALHPPSTLNVSAFQQPTEKVVERAIFAPWVTRSSADEAALRQADSGRYDVHPDVEAAARQITETLRSSASPAFLLEQGLPEIRIPTPELWYRTGRVLVGLLTPGGRFIDIEQTSAAVSRWLHVLILVAVDRWLRARLNRREAIDWSGGLPQRTLAPSGSSRVPRVVTGRVLILDEPELHLHPVAQDQVADWLVRTTAEDGTSALVATHSSQIINAFGPHVRLLGVHRDATTTQVNNLTRDARGALEAAAGRYGSAEASWIQVTRGLLLVEGEHDRMVVEGAYGNELRQQRIAVIPIRGHNNLQGTVLSDFFGRMGIPVRVLLDDVRAAAVNGDPSVSPATSEEKVVQQLLFQRRAYSTLDAVAYDEPDIWCALPMTAVKRARPNAREVTWSTIVADWRRLEKPQGFKSYALKRLKLNDGADVFVKDVMAYVTPEDEFSPSFIESMRNLFDSLR